MLNPKPEKLSIMRLINCIFLVLCTTIPWLGAVEKPPAMDLETRYFQADFPGLVEVLEKKEENTLSLPETLLLIESWARTARGSRGLDKLNTLLAQPAPGSAIFTTAGIVYTSLGQFEKARAYFERSLTIEPGNPRAILGYVLLHLYAQEFAQAETGLDTFIRKNPQLSDSNLLLFTSLEVYKASRNSQKLGEVYDRLAKKYKKQDKSYYQNAKETARIFKKAKGQPLFNVTTASERVVLDFGGPVSPLSAGRDKAGTIKKTIILEIDNKRFRVILDTGNATGWFIYNRELRERLNIRRGGKSQTRIGLAAGRLGGYHILCKKVDFGPFQLHNLAGQYVPKPYPDFYDANINPLFIRNRVVTMDYINQQLILRTTQRFAKDIEGQGASAPLVRLPLAGYERAFIPTFIGHTRALAMIETGAEDIALKLDFARSLGLPLQPHQRYLVDGQVYQYYTTPVNITAGRLVFTRKAVEVWPFERLYNPISGFSASVVIGPAALEGKISLSFDPFSKSAILSRQSF